MSDSRVPTFRIVALGTEGAGKTVYLASLFRELQTPCAGRSWSLDASIEDSRLLGKIYARVVDPEAKWPPGTAIGDMRKFAFDCMVRDGSESHRLLQLSYLDYAGELIDLKDSPVAKVAELESHIRSAHALLGILDGARIAQYLRGEAAGRRYLQTEILPMVGAIAHAKCPVQFLITKWDLLTDIGEPSGATDEDRLRIVREALAEQQDFQRLVDACSRVGKTLRLIPVSAVGDGFATLEKSGAVTKNANGVAEPFNLVTPLAAIVPDFFAMAAAKLTNKDRSRIEHFVERRLSGKWVPSAVFALRVLLRSARAAITSSLRVSPAGAPATLVVDLFFDWIGARSSTRGRAPRADSPNASSLDRTRAGVLDEFEKQIWALERDIPSSVLSGGDW